MKLRVEGWDSERCAYQVTRAYTPEVGWHNFAWFVDEVDAHRFVDMMKDLGDVGAEDSAGESRGNS